MLYFVRVNGNSAHTNPAWSECYVPGEPSHGKNGFINYCQWCLDNGLIRIGWPDTGDLRSGSRDGKRANCYTYESLAANKKRYMVDFVAMPIGSIVLMPEKDEPGFIFIGEVTGGYYYFSDPPSNPYECAHRHEVKWDRNGQGKPQLYHAPSLGIGIMGGWWRFAFAKRAHDAVLIARIGEARQGRANQ